MQLDHKLTLKAFEQVKLCLVQHPVEVALLPNGAPLITALDTNTQALYVLDARVQGLSKLSALSKTQTRSLLEMQIMQICARGTAYAMNSGNLPLQQTLETPVSALRKMGDIGFRDYAIMVYDTLSPLVANLDPIYRILPADLTHLQTVTTDFTSQIPGPNNRQTQIKNLNLQFATLLSDTKAVAKKLDILVKTVQFDKPQFFKSYHDARKLHKANSSPRAVVFNLTDSLTGSPLYKATATFTAQKTGKKLVRMTNKNGSIVINDLPEDVYDGTASHTGHLPFDYTITVLTGQTVTQTIVLQANTKATAKASMSNTTE